MTYASGQTIAALDFNTMAQGGAAVNHTVENVNTLWGVGTGDKGYGQTTLPTLTPVLAGDPVRGPSSWEIMRLRLNSMLTHQNNTTTGIATIATGDTVAYQSLFASKLTTATTNRLLANANASDITGTAPTADSWNTATPTTRQITRTATFGSADQARYFFNAGGKLILTCTAVNTGATAKGADWVTVLQTNFASHSLNGLVNARGGSGGTASLVDTTRSYWNLTTSPQKVIRITSATTTVDYSGNNYVELSVYSGSAVPFGANGDKGYIVKFQMDLNDVAGDAGDTDNLNLTTTTNITVRPPATTQLTTNSWGTVTIS